MLYPILTQSRLLSDLSGVWDFKLDNGKGFDEKWYEAPLKDADTMPVPASYNDLKEGIDFRDHYGWVFYQRNISVPAYVKSQRIVLRCAAVTHFAKIYLNGKLICEHKGGFLPFEVELNDVLEDGDNLLTIAVNNVIDYSTLPVGGKANMMSGLMGGVGQSDSGKPQNNPNFDFFNYCGITRPVKIYTTPKTYIHDITVTSDIDFGKAVPSATLHYEVDIEGADKDNTACKVEVFDAEGKKVWESDGTLSARGARKAAEFVKFCDAFEIPVLTLTNVNGFKATVCGEKMMAKSVGALVHAFADATVPKVNVVIGKAFGTAYTAMNSKAIGADMVYAWENAEIGMMDADLAAKIMYAGDDAAALTEKAAEYRELQNSVSSAAARGYVDTIISPADTRKYVIGAFEMLFTKREERPSKKHGTV